MAQLLAPALMTGVNASPPSPRRSAARRSAMQEARALRRRWLDKHVLPALHCGSQARLHALLGASRGVAVERPWQRAAGLGGEQRGRGRGE